MSIFDIDEVLKLVNLVKTAKNCGMAAAQSEGAASDCISGLVDIAISFDPTGLGALF